MNNRLNTVAIVGSNGYIGQYFTKYLSEMGSNLVHIGRDFTKEDVKGATFLINCAGFTGKPNVDACEDQKLECFKGNAELPFHIGNICKTLGIPWGHISSGCIYHGTKEDGTGFTETDKPNFAFDSKEPCSFYSGTKAVGEETIRDMECYIWRLRIPFNSDIDNTRNYLYKLLNYNKLLNVRNSISHIGDFVKASIECVEKEIPFGIYNVVNGDITTEDIIKIFGRTKYFTEKGFSFYNSEEEFNKTIRAPRSSCVLSNEKLFRHGIEMRSVDEALEESINKYINKRINEL